MLQVGNKYFYKITDTPKNISEHFSCFSEKKGSLWKSLLPLPCTRPQGSDRKPIPALQVLSANVPLSHPSTSAASTGTNPTTRSQDKERSFLLWRASLTIIYWGKWQFLLSSLYTVNTLYTCNNGLQKALIFLGIPRHGKVRCSLILPDKLAQSRVFQSLSPELSHCTPRECFVGNK